MFSGYGRGGFWKGKTALVRRTGTRICTRSIFSPHNVTLYLLNESSLSQQELFRFTMYCVLPVAASVIYANPERMHHLSELSFWSFPVFRGDNSVHVKYLISLTSNVHTHAIPSSHSPHSIFPTRLPLPPPVMYLKFVEYPEAIPSSAIPIGDEVEKFRGAATFTKAATSSKVAIDSGGTSPVAQKKSWWVWW